MFYILLNNLSCSHKDKFLCDFQCRTHILIEIADNNDFIMVSLIIDNWLSGAHYRVFRGLCFS